MKSLHETLSERQSALLDGRACLDGRDLARLADFLPVSDWHRLNITCSDKYDTTKHVPKPWNEEEVRLQLASDLSFAFDKALGQRGLSASLMWEVIRMWMWVLDDQLYHYKTYSQYGLPFFKAVADKYLLPNPIGNDSGTEAKYAP